jgi:hypothetical protein
MGSLLNFIRLKPNVWGVLSTSYYRHNYVTINVIYKKLFMFLCEILITFLRNIDADYSVDTDSTRNILEILNIN